MIDRNHPALKAGAQQLSDYENDGRTYPPIELHYEAAQDALEAAWPELTTATEDNLARLRNTPAGKQLMAEAWTVGAEYAGMGTVDDYDNPYRPGVTRDAPEA